jgi:hypothetical protein
MQSGHRERLRADHRRLSRSFARETSLTRSE